MKLPELASVNREEIKLSLTIYHSVLISNTVVFKAHTFFNTKILKKIVN